MISRQLPYPFIEELTQKIDKIKKDHNYPFFGYTRAKELEALKEIFEKIQQGESVDLNRPIEIDDSGGSASLRSGPYTTSYLKIALNLKIEFVKYLLESGAKPYDKVIHDFLKYKKDDNLDEIQEKLTLLKQFDANFNALNKKHHTPLYVAEFNRKVGTAKLLERFGAHKTMNEKLMLPLERYKKEFDDNLTRLVVKFSGPR